MDSLVKRLADALREARTYLDRDSYCDRMRNIIDMLLRECAAAERGEAQPVARFIAAQKSLDPEFGHIANERFDELIAAPPAVPEGTCEWSYVDDDFGTWESACGQVFCFEAGDPVENKMRYCHGCGKKLVLAAAPQPGERG